MSTRLNLGSGTRPKKGYLNVDLKSGLNSIQLDIRDIKTKFTKESVEAILLCHVLEHLSKQDAEKLLDDCADLLEEGGVFTIEVPDLYKTAKRFVELIDEGKEDEAYTSPINGFYGEVFPKTEGDYHKYGWTEQKLISHLKKRGLEIKKVTSGKVKWRDVNIVAVKKPFNDKIL